MIVLQHASRWYGNVIGINDVSCQLLPGITALLGPNGAGKSTMFKLISGQLKPTTGQVTIFGLRPFANAAVFRRLGYCPESEASYSEMTGKEFVTMMGALAGIPSLKLHTRVAEVIELVKMTPNATRKIGGYSKGMRQRIKLAQALIHDPEVLLLDEPLNGLDPAGRREMTALFHHLASQGKCLVVSSHILYEVEQLTHNILLMHRGRLLAQGDMFYIRSLIDQHPHRISITTTEPRRLAAHLIALPYVLSARFDQRLPEWVEIETRNPEQFYTRFPDIVMENDFVVPSLESPDNNLEAVFRYLVGS